MEQAELTGSWRGVAVSGNTIVIGSDESVFVFVRSGSGWTEQAKLTTSDGAASDLFGGRVAISGDTVVISGYRYRGAFVFVRSGGSTAWTEQGKLTNLVDFRLGNLAFDGDTLAIGYTSLKSKGAV